MIRRQAASASTVLIGFVVALFTAAAAAENIVFPEDAGLVDVTKAPYFAKGDGKTDDSEALQQALHDHPAANRIIYLPNGTYLVSSTLRWPWHTNLVQRYRSTILQGQSREKTVIRLADQAAGFNKSSRSRPVLWTGERGAPRPRNSIRNLTVEIGTNNPIAIGIQFYSNKQGGLRDVTVRSLSGDGVAGIDMSHSDETGPSLLKNVRVEGFEFGLRAGYAFLGATLEDVEFEGQSEAAIRNVGQCLSIRGMRSTNRVHAIQSTEINSFVTLADSTLAVVPGSKPMPAIQNRGFLIGRGFSTPGYSRAVENRAGTGIDATGPNVREFLSHRLFSLFPSPQYAIGLPVRETPVLPWDPISEWTSPLAYGGKPNDSVDDSDALQKAIDSGKSTVYLPHGYWTLYKPVFLRGNVRRLIGCEARIRIDNLGRHAALTVADGAAPVVLIERIEVETFDQLFLSQDTARTLVLSSCSGIRAAFPGKGDLFLEDVHAARTLAFTNKNVWARQLCIDHEGPKIINSGGNFWAFGLTTERGGTVVRTTDKGRTEVIGGMVNSSGGWKDDPMFRIDDASASFTISEASFSLAPFTTVVREKRGDQVKILSHEGLPGLAMPPHAGGVAVPLFTGYGSGGR